MATGTVSLNERNLVVSFIQFLRQKVSNGQCTDEQIEGLEVAVQCLEAAFGLSDANYAFQPSRPLLDIFQTAEGLPAGENELAEPTEAEKEQSRTLKEEGNNAMKVEKFDEAVQNYNEAIKLHRDPVYFCNRAAAYCKLNQYDLAIQDCRTALALDPNYSKAYGRMGLALSCQNRYEQAVEAYKRALELEPDQESYKNNLRIAEGKVQEAEENSRNEQNGAAQQQNPFGALPGMNIGAMLSNPQMMNMVGQMMADPSIQNLMTNMVGSMGGGGGGGGGGPGDNQQPAAGNNLGNLMQAGQRLAEQMQQQNPELIEQLSRQFGVGARPNADNPDQSGQPPDSGKGGGGSN